MLMILSFFILCKLWIEAPLGLLAVGHLTPPINPSRMIKTTKISRWTATIIPLRTQLLVLDVIVQSQNWSKRNCPLRKSYLELNASSTAQGGGGSFKNRKPIGEIGCCESGMAERIHWWTERCLRSPLFLSLSLTIYPPTNLSSMYLSIYLSIYLSLSLSFI